jgi:hypothetical protein
MESELVPVVQQRQLSSLQRLRSNAFHLRPHLQLQTKQHELHPEPAAKK